MRRAASIFDCESY